MNRQITTLPTTCANTCIIDTTGNNVIVNGVMYMHVETDSTTEEVILEFLPVHMWKSDDWSESDVVQVVVPKPTQSGFVGESEWELSPESEGYDHYSAEMEIIRDAASHLYMHLEELEVRHAS